MEMKQSSTPPPAVGLAYIIGLVSVFLGERVLSATSARWAFTACGVGLIATYAGIRWTGAVSGASDRRAVDRTLAVLASGTLLAVVLELLTTDAGERLIGLADAAASKREHFETVALVVWAAGILLTVIAVLLAELALLPMRRGDRIEGRRITAAVGAGVVVGMALTYGALFTYTAGELEVKADFSYFKTSMPSDSTRNIINNLGEPVKVVAFFPKLNDVGREVWAYLRELARKSPRLTVEMHDRLLEPQLAKDDKVTQDGVLVLQKGPGKSLSSSVPSSTRRAPS